MGQGPTPFLRATAQTRRSWGALSPLNGKSRQEEGLPPRAEAPTHQARMPPRCTIAIVHEQGTEVRSEMNTPPSPVHARETSRARHALWHPPHPLRPANPARFAAFAAPPLPPASPVCDFWAVSQAESTRNTARCRRFPRSTKPTADSTRRKPSRSPGPMAKSAPVSCKTVQKPQGTNAC